MTYCNIAWASTNFTKLKKLYSKQKHACRIVFGANKIEPCEPLLRSLGALKIYKLNLHQILVFMYKTKLGISPKIFESYFSEISHKYPTRFSENNFVVPKYNLKLSLYSIRYRGPYLWKMFSDFLNKNNRSTLDHFKNESKQYFLSRNYTMLDMKCFF